MDYFLPIAFLFHFQVVVAFGNLNRDNIDVAIFFVVYVLI